MYRRIPQMDRLTFESCETVTQSEFAAWVEKRHDDNHYELLNGRVVMEPPAGWPHGQVEVKLSSALFAAAKGLGEVCGSSQGFELPSEDTVEPDLSFVSNERLEAGPEPVYGKFLKLVPDLIVEILSPGNAYRDRGEKKAIYERNGVREYWLVDTRTQRLTRFLLKGDRFDRGTHFESTDVAESEIIPKFRVDVGELFA